MPRQNHVEHTCGARIAGGRLTLRAFLPCLFLAVLSAGPAVAQVGAQPTEDQAELRIREALDQPTSLTAEDEPIRSVLNKLGRSNDVEIELADDTLGYLPYGSQTKLRVTIENRTLREALDALLTPLGLTFEVQDGAVMVIPTPPLRRIAHRASWDELETLERLYSEPWSKELFDSLKLQFRGSRSDMASNRATLERLAEAVGAGSAAEVLEHACDEYGWSWHPEDDLIVILPKSRQIERQLETPVTLDYDQVTLEEALLDLARRANVLLIIDPGTMASLPPQASTRFSLRIRNMPVRQVLETISGQAGLRYFVESEGVRITTGGIDAPVTGTTSPTAAATGGTDAANSLKALSTNRIVGSITVPGGQDGTTFSFFIREDDLPPEVKQMREQKISEAVNQMRRMLHAELPGD